MAERLSPSDFGKKFIARPGGKITLRPDHGSKNSNGRGAERPGKRPRFDLPPGVDEIQQGIEEYFFDRPNT